MRFEDEIKKITGTLNGVIEEEQSLADFIPADAWNTMDDGQKATALIRTAAERGSEWLSEIGVDESTPIDELMSKVQSSAVEGAGEQGDASGNNDGSTENTVSNTSGTVGADSNANVPADTNSSSMSKYTEPDAPLRPQGV